MSGIKARGSAYHDRTKIMFDILSANDLSCSDVVYICDTPESSVFKWLNGDLKPTRFALMQLYRALFKARMLIPKSLSAFARSQQSRANYWGIKNRTEKEKVTEILAGQEIKNGVK